MQPRENVGVPHVILASTEVGGTDISRQDKKRQCSPPIVVIYWLYMVVIMLAWINLEKLKPCTHKSLK